MINESDRLFSEISLEINEAIKDGQKRMFMIIGIQGCGKTTLWERINKHFNVDDKTIIGMSSADMYMPDIFDFNLLTECHRKCITDIFNISSSGKHTYVDNMGSNSSFRTIYKYISDVLDIKLCKYIFSADKWLDCEEVNSEFIDTLTRRCFDRHKRGGKYIDKEIIMRSIDNSRLDFKKSNSNIDSWLNHYPIPFYKKGISNFEGNIIVRNETIDTIASESISDPRLINRETDILRKQIRNGIEHHITLISKEELTDEIQAKIEDTDLIKTLGSIDRPISKGIEKCINTDGDDTIFVVIEWTWGNKLRDAVGLCKKVFHITLM